MRHRLPIVILIAALAACQGKSDSGRPAAVTDELVKATDRVVAALGAMSADVAAAGTDCKKATAALRNHHDAIAGIAADADRVEKVFSSADAATKTWFEEHYRGRLIETNRKVMATAMGCMKDKDFKQALDDVNHH